MPNDIVKRQNSEQFVKLLRARQRAYQKATFYQITQFLAVVVIPLLGSLLAVLSSSFRPGIAALTVCITVIDVLILDRRQKQRIKEAAKISEQFDCELLLMPWNKFISGKKVDPEYIVELASEWKKGDGKLLNWYPSIPPEEDMNIVRVVCQRSNLWYDKSVRVKYGDWLLISLAVLALIITVVGAFVLSSLVDFVISVLVPAAPVFIWAIRDFYRQKDAAESVEAVKAEADALLERVAAGSFKPEELPVRSREFQDAMYNRRSTAPLILPFVYGRLRDKLEEKMNAGASEILKRVRPAA